MKIDLKKVSSSLIFSMALSVMICAHSQAAEEVPQVLPLQNAGFENGLANWAATPEFKEQVTVENSLAHEGTKSLKIDATVKHNTPFVTHNIGGLVGGSTYQFSVWARAAPGSSAVTAAVKMETYNAAGENVSGHYGQTLLPADGSWKQVQVQQRTPGDAARSALLLRVFGDGAVLFDDAAFVMIEHAPDLTVIAPLQTAIEPEQASRLTYQLLLRQPWSEAEAPRVTAKLRSLDEDAVLPASNEIQVAVTPAGDRQRYNASVTLPKLAAGSYAIDFQYRQKDEILQTTFPAYIFTKIADRRPQSLTADGTILWNGKPFFPIGIYHPGDYQRLAENGFNAVQGDATLDLEKFKSSLDLAQKYGLAVDVPLYNGMQVKKNLSNSLEKVKRFADHPAVLTWKIFDEPHINPDGGVAIDIPAAYRALKSAAPKQPIELTLNTAATQEFWSNFCDVAQADSYPVPRFPLTEVSDLARNAKGALQPWQNLSFVLQCGWVPDLSNQPSVAQARSMVYLALIEGAKGIWWYSMHDPGWDLAKTPLWPHMKAINAEIHTLSQPLMLGKVIEGVSCDQPGVFFRAVEYQNKTFLLVTNPQNAPAQATFTLPDNLRAYHSLGSDTKQKLDKRQLVVHLTGVDSRTFVLEK
jgi:hypothetical protein